MGWINGGKRPKEPLNMSDTCWRRLVLVLSSVFYRRWDRDPKLLEVPRQWGPKLIAWCSKAQQTLPVSQQTLPLWASLSDPGWSWLPDGLSAKPLSFCQLPDEEEFVTALLRKELEGNCVKWHTLQHKPSPPAMPHLSQWPNSDQTRSCFRINPSPALCLQLQLNWSRLALFYPTTHPILNTW